MKKLNITKEAFSKSRYFTKKYGTLKYVSESGKLFKTSKGKVLQFNESWLGDKVKDGWNKVKDGAKKLGKKIGDAFNGPFRKGDHITMTGEDGEKVNGTIVDFDLEDKEYRVLLGNKTDEALEDEVLAMPNRHSEIADLINELMDADSWDRETAIELAKLAVEWYELSGEKIFD